MRSMPLRRSDQTHFAYGAESGAMSPPTARPRTPSALSARQGTLRETTGAQLRGVGWEEAACVHTTAKCANCGGPHGARADACVAKKIAQHASRGRRPPPPPRREKRREVPGTEAPGVEEEDVPEVEMEEVGGEGHGAAEE